MTDEQFWIAAYLAALAAGHDDPYQHAEIALSDYRQRWGD